jgi:hypothetical protein
VRYETYGGSDFLFLLLTTAAPQQAECHYTLMVFKIQVAQCQIKKECQTELLSGHFGIRQDNEGQKLTRAFGTS